MSSRIFLLSIGAFLIGVTAPVALAFLNEPSWIDDAFRQCMGDAIDHEMEQRIDALRDYNDEQIDDLETYRNELRFAWQISNEDDRTDELRDVNRRYRDAVRETKRDYDQRIRDILKESRDAQRSCRTARSDHRRFVRNMCTSSNDCRGNLICSTEYGVCNPSCPSDVQSCAQVCAGTCVRATSSRSFSSRSSSSRFSSSSWSIVPYSSSSRSSKSSVTGVNCQPYTCPDGREVPACTPDGRPIDYTSNPCYT